MTATETLRERYKFINTLACLVKACEGKKTVVELRDNTSVFGTIVQVDGHLNITMSSVVYKRPKQDPLKFEEFFVRGTKLRHVLIPNEIDIRKAISQQLKYYTVDRRKTHSGMVKPAAGSGKNPGKRFSRDGWGAGRGQGSRMGMH